MRIKICCATLAHTLKHTHTHMCICAVCAYVFCVFFVRHFLWLRAHKKRIKWLQHGIKNAPKSANRERGRQREGGGGQGVSRNDPSRCGHFWVVNEAGQAGG